MNLEMAGRPSQKQMVLRLVRFLQAQLQKITDPWKLHTLQSDIARLKRQAQ